MLKNATFRQLSAFHAVARLGSVSRAASELHLTQPAVSIQLKLLEESAGTPLLQREGRGVRLTQAGDLMAVYAGRILDLWREVGDEMATHRGVFSGTLRVGAVTTAEYLLPPLLVTFVSEHPKVKVKLQVGNRAEIVRMLAGHEVDMAIMGRPPGELKTVSTAFAKHPMAFIATPKHPLMSQRKLTLTDLVGANLLVRERGSGTRTTLERLFKDEGIPLRIGSELSSNEAIKQMCAAGFGVAFLSLHTCGLELDAGLLKLLPLAGNPVEREWFVMHLASTQLAQVAAAFERFLSSTDSVISRSSCGAHPTAPPAPEINISITGVAGAAPMPRANEVGWWLTTRPGSAQGQHKMARGSTRWPRPMNATGLPRRIVLPCYETIFSWANFLTHPLLPRRGRRVHEVTSILHECPSGRTNELVPGPRATGALKDAFMEPACPHAEARPSSSGSWLYLLERFDIGVVQLDREMRVVGMNDFARRSLPVDEKMPFGKLVTSFHPEVSRAKVEFLLGQAECPVNNAPPMTMMINFPDRVLLIKVSKLSDEHGATTGYSLVFYDITEVISQESDRGSARGAGEGAGTGKRLLRKIPTIRQNRVLLVDVPEVSYIRSEGHYTWVHTGQGSQFCNINIGDLESRLDPSQFLRIHRSYIVNLSHVDEIVRSEGRVALRMMGPAPVEIPVSRASAPALLQQLGLAGVTPSKP